MPISRMHRHYNHDCYALLAPLKNSAKIDRRAVVEQFHFNAS